MSFWAAGDEATVAKLNDQLTEFIPHDPDRLGAETEAVASSIGDYPTGSMPDAAKSSSHYSGFFVGAPSRVVIMVIPVASGDVAWYCTTDFASEGEVHTTNSDSLGSDGTPQVDTVTVNEHEALDITDAFTGATAGDFFGLEFIRDGDDALDTISNVVHILGLLIEY